MAEMTLNINGHARVVDVEPDTPLLWVLRDDLNLVGTKYGCGIGACGSCTVLVDGSAMRACLIRASSVRNAEVVTIEGLDALAIEQIGIAHCSGSDDPGDLTPHQSLGLRRIFDLIAKSYLQAGSQELAEIDFERMMRYTTHRHFALLAAVPGGERDFENRCDTLGVVEKDFEEISHAIKDHRIRMLGLHLGVVTQHGRQLN